MTTEGGNDIACTWQGAEVSRALHSVSQIAGPEDGEGKHDVLFNNKCGVVLAPGVVNAILENLAKQGKKPIATYRRKGGLYLAKMKMRSAPDNKGSGFPRPGAGA